MRSLFVALGLFVALWGGFFLVVDQMVISSQSRLFSIELLRGWSTKWDNGQMAFHPPEWAAFSLLSIGSLMIVYALGLPARTPSHRISLLDSHRHHFHAPHGSQLSR